jgi:hypothetical protein
MAETELIIQEKLFLSTLPLFALVGRVRIITG